MLRWFPYMCYHIPTQTYSKGRVALYNEKEFIQYLSNWKTDAFIYYPERAGCFPMVMDNRIYHRQVQRPVPAS